MKTRLTITLALAFCFIYIHAGCREKQIPVAEEAVVIVEPDLIHDEFPEAKRELETTLDEIVQSVKDGDIDKLIAFHAYTPKFTEFKNGEPRNGAEANETFERNTFSAVTEVIKMDMEDVKIAVYGDVANVTFHSDFHLKFGEDLVMVKDQITLLFVKNEEGQWKIVHEHHSPLKVEEGES